ncbi:MAG: hypothetical protein ACLP22_10200 [Solirubrobacteraceae bacterium]
MVISGPHLARERRHGTSTAPWRVVVDRQTGNVFFATNQSSGRSYRLSVLSLDEAEAQVELLNCTSLEIRV